MKCRIDGANLGSFSRIITALATIGDEEIHFAFTERTLTLTVFNASLSGASTGTFYNTFFHTFSVPRGCTKTFKLPVKCIVKPFRSLKFLKSCLFCDIIFEEDKDVITVTIGCKTLAEIRYTIKLLDNEDELHTDYDPDKLANWIRTDPKFMTSTLSNFSHGKGLIDLTLKALRNNIVLKNCATDLMRKEGKLYTELSVSSHAFDRISINEETEVTFQLKDFKTFITLAEHMKLSMSIHFQDNHEPVMICVKNEQLEATLLLATKFIEPADLIDNGSSGSTGSSSNAISNVSSVAPPSNPIHRMRIPVAVAVGNSKTAHPPHERMRNAEQPSEAAVDIPSLVPEVDRTPNVPNLLSPQSPARNSRLTTRTKKKKPVEQDEEDIENVAKVVKPSSRKRMRDLYAKLNAPYNIYKKFPGHDIVLVPASSDEDEDENNEQNS